MESARSPWRTLRPLLLAGAAATAWLALSAPAANAESTPDTGSLLGTISSSVSSVAGTAATPVNDALASVGHAVAGPPAQPAAPESAGMLQPLTGAATGTVDYFIDAVPVVDQIVPSGTSGTVTSPVIAAADTFVAEAAHAVLPAAGDALPVLEPVLEPVDELLAGTDTLPLPLPGSEALAPGLAAVTDSSAFDGVFGTEVGLAPGVQLDAIPLSYRLSLTPESALSLPVANLGSARSSAPAWSPESPGNGDGTAGPYKLPAVPGSGSGTSQSSGAGPGGSAWLSTFHLDVPLTGVFPVSGPLQNSPAPVSFDPGSSPD
ncbi:hypothetical protein AB0N24_02190 [Arthrobacter sp. NPDC093128]|uniref:hypothetical protein n=1 Tax=Arthrobacter sp. NPDC093128 TaxID=3154979 RepID=UPI00342BB2E4